MQPWNAQELKQAIDILEESKDIGFIYRKDSPAVETTPVGNSSVVMLRDLAEVYDTTLHLAGFMKDFYGNYSDRDRRQTINRLLGEAHFGRRKGAEQRYYIRHEEQGIGQILRLDVKKTSREAYSYKDNLEYADKERLLFPKKQLTPLQER